VRKAAGGLSCHSASSFCSRLQAILLSACTGEKGSIELLAELRRKTHRRGAAPGGESGGLGGGETGTFREGEEELVMVGTGLLVLGKGIEF
jgi:hypothetical protein